MAHLTTSIHAQAGLQRKLVLFGAQLEGYLHTLQPIKRGVDFVGYRTWASGRYVRPSLLTAIRFDARRGKIASIVSRIGHALRTKSLAHILRHL